MAQLELIKKTLEYYADPAQYVNGQIEKDRGHLAKHTLSLINDTKKQLDSAQELYMKTHAELFPITDKSIEISDGQLPVESVEKLKAISNLLSKYNEKR